MKQPKGSWPTGSTINRRLFLIDSLYYQGRGIVGTVSRPSFRTGHDSGTGNAVTNPISHISPLPRGGNYFSDSERRALRRVSFFRVFRFDPLKPLIPYTKRNFRPKFYPENPDF